MANKALAKQNYYFPENFHFGASTSAFQIEGAWNEDGKGESVWDKGMHGYPQFVFDGANGDIACDSYHQYQKDVQMIKNLKLNVYRFSISWSRILPNGKINYINQKGIDYYNQLIDELLKNGIIPYVTMYHWDLPQPLQDEGGWTNSKIIDYFVDYARILFQKFGDRVKHWITINEIKQFCTRGYGISSMPIFRTDPPITQKSVKAGYEAAHHGLLAHAKTYRLYQKDFKKTQMGLIGLSGDCEWVDPSDPTNKEDIEASITALEISVSSVKMLKIYQKPVINYRKPFSVQSSTRGTIQDTQHLDL